MIEIALSHMFVESRQQFLVGQKARRVLVESRVACSLCGAPIGARCQGGTSRIRGDYGSGKPTQQPHHERRRDAWKMFLNEELERVKHQYKVPI